MGGPSRYSIEKNEITSSSSRDNRVLSDRKLVPFSKIHSRVPLAQPKLDLPEENNRLGGILERLLSLTEDDRKSETTPEKVISKFNTPVDVEKVIGQFTESDRLRRATWEKDHRLREVLYDVSKLDIYADVVHKNLYHYFKSSDGTSDMASAQILTTIISWYLPKKGSNLKKRFKGDFLHMKYRDFQEAHGCTRKEVEITLRKLKSLGFIETFLENIECVVRGTRKTLANRMMIKLNAKKVAEIVPERSYTNRGNRRSSYDRISFFEPEGVESKSWKESDNYIAGIQRKISVLEFYNGKIPTEFFRTFVNKTGYSNRLAAALMTKIVTLYLPKKEGVVSKRFFHDLLHFTYEDLQNYFNVSRKQLQYAFRILKNAGVIDIEYGVTRRLKNGSKVSVSNSMMIKLNADKISEILPTKTVRMCGTVDHSKNTDPYKLLPGTHDENTSKNFTLHGVMRPFSRIKHHDLKGETCTTVSPLVAKATFPPRGESKFFNSFSSNTSPAFRLRPCVLNPDRGKRKFISTESGVEGVLWGDLRRPWVEIARERSILADAIEGFKEERRRFVSRAISMDFKMNQRWKELAINEGICGEYLKKVFHEFKAHWSRRNADGRRSYKENWFYTWQQWCRQAKKHQCDRIPDYARGFSYSNSERSQETSVQTETERRVQSFKDELSRRISGSAARDIFKSSEINFEENTLKITTDFAVTGDILGSLSDAILRECAQSDVCITVLHPIFPGGKKVTEINL